MKIKEVKILLSLIIICLLLINIVSLIDYNRSNFLSLYFFSRNIIENYGNSNKNLKSSDFLNYDNYRLKNKKDFEITGSLTKYKLSNIFRNFQIQDDKLYINYNVVFNNYSPDWDKIEYIFSFQDSNWKLVSYNVKIDGDIINQYDTNTNPVNKYLDKAKNYSKKITNLIMLLLLPHSVRR